MLDRLLHTAPSYSVLGARLALGAVLFAHGAQKVGGFGGPGWAGTMAFFTEGLGVPAPLAAGVIAFEVFGALALRLGLLGRPLAAAAAGVMLGAIALVHAPHGFFMNWVGAQAGEGYEFHLLALALSLVVSAQGSGAWSLDRALARRWARAPRRGAEAA